jgi:hypothetical protein
MKHIISAQLSKLNSAIVTPRQFTSTNKKTSSLSQMKVKSELKKTDIKKKFHPMLQTANISSF